MSRRKRRAELLLLPRLAIPNFDKFFVVRMVSVKGNALHNFCGNDEAAPSPERRKGIDVRYQPVDVGITTGDVGRTEIRNVHVGKRIVYGQNHIFIYLCHAYANRSTTIILPDHKMNRAWVRAIRRWLKFLN